MELSVVVTTQKLYYLIKNSTVPNESIVSGHTGRSEHAPPQWQRMLANFFSGLIVGIFRTMISIFSTIFRMLSNLA